MTLWTRDLACAPRRKPEARDARWPGRASCADAIGNVSGIVHRIAVQVFVPAVWLRWTPVTKAGTAVSETFTSSAKGPIRAQKRRPWSEQCARFGSFGMANGPNALSIDGRRGIPAESRAARPSATGDARLRRRAQDGAPVLPRRTRLDCLRHLTTPLFRQSVTLTVFGRYDRERISSVT
jgi:hypothetical protein